ncbi:MAG: 5-oxoprolinase subunit PxpA [Acidobacteria bacterium]|nr:MAG: 5-oxoprolinase subunit PxpA [Acidobacteriota bacterium]
MSQDASRHVTIDLNADVGELPDALDDGREEALLGLVTSANIACGGHAGDERTMAAVLGLARRLGVAAGAHPGYPDRATFGRVSAGMDADAIERTVFEQVRALAAAASRAGTVLLHVKPHGALYNDAAGDAGVAAAVARGVARWGRSVALVGLAGSRCLQVYDGYGFEAVGEGFADRAYEANGTLRSRALPGALHADPRVAAAQAVRIAVRRRVGTFDGGEIGLDARTICVHGDSPGAADVARAVRAALLAAGVRLAPVGGRPA